MKIVINKCFGGFGLSPKAIKRLAELNGKECYFFKSEYKLGQDKYIPQDIEECKSLFWSAFSVSNPNEVLGESKRGEDGSYKEFNKRYSKIQIPDYSYDRINKLLIQVIEELGEEANGRCANLQIIEIPDDTEYEIDEYDGMESIHEKHRSWS